MEALQILAPTKPIRRRLPVLPYKLEDRLDLPSEMRVNATFEEFIELSIEAEYKVEYMDGQVISIFDYDKINDTMSTASLTHENLVANLIYQLYTLFDHIPDARILGSNMSTFIEWGKATFNPDVTVVIGEPQTRKYKYNKKTQTVLLNPSVVVEVLSQSTRVYDLEEKLEKYKQLATIEQIIFVEQYWTQVITHKRLSDDNWQVIETDDIDSSIPVGNAYLSLQGVYKKVIFPK